MPRRLEPCHRQTRQHRARHAWPRLARLATLLLLVCPLLTTACGGSQQVRPEDTDSWRRRGLWIEKEGDTSIVMVVGRAENASMGETFVLASAEQDARARLSLYLQATVSAFRERLARAMATQGRAAGHDEVTGGYATTEDIRQGDRAVADNVVGGMETINSFTDTQADRFYVLGRVDLETLKRLLAQSDALTSSEKAMIRENSEVVRQAWDEATEAGRTQVLSEGT